MGGTSKPGNAKHSALPGLILDVYQLTLRRALFWRVLMFQRKCEMTASQKAPDARLMIVQPIPLPT
jgi:hypothetical protein